MEKELSVFNSLHLSYASLIKVECHYLFQLDLLLGCRYEIFALRRT